MHDMLRRIEASELAAVYALTGREVEVPARASAGDGNAAIAAALRVSRDGQDASRARLREARGAPRSEAAGRARSLGLV
jgi:FixJ family two-component response regulator